MTVRGGATDFDQIISVTWHTASRKRLPSATGVVISDGLRLNRGHQRLRACLSSVVRRDISRHVIKPFEFHDMPARHQITRIGGDESGAGGERQRPRTVAALRVTIARTGLIPVPARSPPG